MLRKAIVQYTYYTSVPNIHYTFPSTKYNGSIRASYPKGYEVTDSNFNHDIFHESSIPFSIYPNIVERHFFHIDPPYGSGKKKYVNNSRHKYNNPYSSLSSSYTRHSDNNSSYYKKKSYKNKHVKEVKSVNYETTPSKSSSYVSYLPKSTERISSYKPLFMLNNYSSHIISKPMYIKVKQAEPVLEKTLLSRNK